MSQFDSKDIDYLETHLTPEQLRQEIQKARVIEDTNGEGYWHGFRTTCEKALEQQSG